MVKVFPLPLPGGEFSLIFENLVVGSWKCGGSPNTEPPWTFILWVNWAPGNSSVGVQAFLPLSSSGRAFSCTSSLLSRNAPYLPLHLSDFGGSALSRDLNSLIDLRRVSDFQFVEFLSCCVVGSDDFPSPYRKSPATHFINDSQRDGIKISHKASRVKH